MNQVPEVLQNLDPVATSQRMRTRKRRSRIFHALCLGIAGVSALIVFLLLFSIGYQGSSSLNATFLTEAHDPENPARAGIYPAIIGSVCLCLICAVAALPIGIATAIYLEEFQPVGLWWRRFHGFVQLNIANLAGVPSVVYGLLGLTVFVHAFQLFGKLEQNDISGLDFWGVQRYYQFLALDQRSTVLVPLADPEQHILEIDRPMEAVDGHFRKVEMLVWNDSEPLPTDPAMLARTVRHGEKGGLVEVYQWYYFRLPFGPSLLAASLTLALVILPIIVIATQEALRAVPLSLREASAGMGANRWQTVQEVTFPAALPGIMTGAILAMGRALGEAAPIFVILGGNIGKPGGPEHLMDSCVTLPILIFAWADNPIERYRQLAAAAIIVLVLILLLMNSAAIYFRHRAMQTS